MNQQEMPHNNTYVNDIFKGNGATGQGLYS